jgi:hypothetical protein
MQAPILSECFRERRWNVDDGGALRGSIDDAANKDEEGEKGHAHG